MENMKDLIEELGIDQYITLEDIPDLDLYMDQVIQLFERKYQHLKRNENDKVLTKTMINNYAKGKLFFPITNKKYSKEHIILISMIYHLKGALSINDIKKTLDSVNTKTENETFDLDHFYSIYLDLALKHASKFEDDVLSLVDDVEQATNRNVLKHDQQFHDMEKLHLITSFVNMSNFYRKAAERLVDTLSEPVETEKNKSKN